MKIRVNKKINELINNLLNLSDNNIILTNILNEADDLSNDMEDIDVEFDNIISAVVKESSLSNILASFKMDPKLFVGGMVKNIIFPTVPSEIGTMFSKEFMPDKFVNINNSLDVDPNKTISKATDFAFGFKGLGGSFKVESKKKKTSQKNENFELANYIENQYLPLNEIYNLCSNLNALNESAVLTLGLGLGSIAGTIAKDVIVVGVATAGATAIKLAPVLITAAMAGRLLTGLTEDHGAHVTDDSKLKEKIKEQEEVDKNRLPTVNNSKDIVNSINSYLNQLTESVSILLQHFSANGGKIAEEFEKAITDLQAAAGKDVEKVLIGLNEFEKQLEDLNRRRKEATAERKANQFDAVKNTIKSILNIDIDKEGGSEKFAKKIGTENTSYHIGYDINKKLNEDNNNSVDISEKTTLDCTKIYIDSYNLLHKILAKVFVNDQDEWKDMKRAKEQMELLLKKNDESFNRQIDIICRTGNQDTTKNLSDNIKKFISQHPMRAEGLKRIWANHYNDLEQRIAMRLDDMKSNDIMRCIRYYVSNTLPLLYAMMITYLSMAKVLSDAKSITTDVHRLSEDEIANKVKAQISLLEPIIMGIFSTEGYSGMLSNSNAPVRNKEDGEYNGKADMRYTGLFIRNIINIGKDQSIDQPTIDEKRYPNEFFTLCMKFNQYAMTANSQLFVVNFINLLGLLCPTAYSQLININDDEKAVEEFGKIMKKMFTQSSKEKAQIDQLAASLQKNSRNLIGNLKNNEAIKNAIKLVFSHPELLNYIDELNKIEVSEDKSNIAEQIKLVVNKYGENNKDGENTTKFNLSITPTIDAAVDKIKGLNNIFIIPSNADIYSYINALDVLLKLDQYIPLEDKDNNTALNRFLKLVNLLSCPALQNVAADSIDVNDLARFAKDYSSTDKTLDKINIIDSFASAPLSDDINPNDIEDKDYLTKLLDTKFNSINNDFYKPLINGTEGTLELPNISDIAKAVVESIGAEYTGDLSMNEFVELIKGKGKYKIKNKQLFLNIIGSFKDMLTNVYLKIIELKLKNEKPENNEDQEIPNDKILKTLITSYNNTIENGLKPSGFYLTISDLTQGIYDEQYINVIEEKVGKLDSIKEPFINTLNAYIENPSKILKADLDKSTMIISTTKPTYDYIDPSTNAKEEKNIESVDQINLKYLVKNDDITTIADLLKYDKDKVETNLNVNFANSLTCLKSTLLYLFNMAINTTCANFVSSDDEILNKLKDRYKSVNDLFSDILAAKKIIENSTIENIDSIKEQFDKLLDSFCENINNLVADITGKDTTIKLFSDEFIKDNNFVDYENFIKILLENYKEIYIQYINILYSTIFGKEKGQGENCEILLKIKKIIYSE